ncbi:LbtU family siderophore porin [Desulfosarcina sp.]|uniref:LbtU family siderophore porin n=1 Tax=Desulfosarcina sp. TaxID=2027861 RepID=UPI00397065A4
MKARTIKAVLLGMATVVWLCLTGMLSAAGAEESTEPQAGGVTSIEDRIEHLEQAIGRTVEGDRWYDRLQISGLIEVEAGYGKIDFEDPAEADEKTSDVDLATVELDVDVKIVDHVDGHVLFKYEEDDVFMDEGFITLTGTEAFPAYLIAGRQYIPFGNFDSHFVTDPTTLVLGETNEGAVVAGYRFGGEMVHIAAGVFNGGAQETGDDDVIDSFVASVAVNPLEGLTFGASYNSNLAGSDSFNEAVVDPDNLDSLVGGWSAYVSYAFLERFKIIAEYVGALDSFRAGEIYDPGETKERDLSAWNIELGAMIIDRLELAVRYGGSDDGGNDFLSETQYGIVVNWGFFENTNLALEYLHDEYEDDFQEVETLTAQLAIEF